MIETERLEIRRLHPRDLEAFQAYRTDPELARYQGWDVTTDAEALEFLKTHHNIQFLTPGTWHQLGIVCDQQLIGDIGVFFDTEYCELGITLSARYHKQGYAREALAAVIAWLWRTTGIAYIQAITLAENTACVNLLERLGMIRRGQDEAEVIYRLSRKG